jgi:hypothetical protein
MVRETEMSKLASQQCAANKKCVEKEKGVLLIQYQTSDQVPVRHTLYTPGGVMHTNNHLRGTWRTMLSDGPVHIAKLMRLVRV